MWMGILSVLHRLEACATFHDRRHLDRRHVVEHHLVLLDRPLVEHLGRDVFRLDVDPLRFRLVEDLRQTLFR